MRIHHIYNNLTTTEVLGIANDWETKYCNSTSDKRVVSEFYYSAVTFLVKTIHTVHVYTHMHIAT